MTNGVLMQIYLAIFSIISIAYAIRNFARHRIIEPIEFWWGIFLAAMLAVSFIPDFFYWCNSMKQRHIIILMLVATIFFTSLFSTFQTISLLVNQNRELAMQVSMLNQENEQMMTKLGIIQGRDEENKTDEIQEENTVHH